MVRNRWMDFKYMVLCQEEIVDNKEKIEDFCFDCQHIYFILIIFCTTLIGNFQALMLSKR